MSTDTEKPVILIVDDEQRNINIIKEIIDDEHPIVTATDGQEALEKLEDKSPALILLDIMMPGIDGYEVCNKVRADSRHALTKIILVSGKAMVDERLKGYESGADDYVTKPFDHKELMAKIDVFMKLHCTQKELHDINKSLEQEVKRRTQDLLNAERMAFIGMHTAELVHNLNSPLAAVIGHANLLLESDPLSNDAKKIFQAAYKLTGIVNSILSTTCSNYDDQKQRINLNEIIQSELDMFLIDDFFKHDVTTEQSFQDIPIILGVPSHFSQIIGNLIKNSLDSMRESDSDKNILSVTTEKKGEHIEIRVSDTGHGITEENKNKIFEPLFTTKSKKNEGDRPKGTGLGLPSCKKMIEAYGGNIAVESALSQQTTFLLEVPIEE